MICPTCKRPKTKEDFYYRKGTDIKVSADCKSCISEKGKEKFNREEKEGLFNLKEFAFLYRI